jgi:dnd system-associated protein 4
MPEATRSSGRVSIESSVHDIYKQLTGGKDAELSPFSTMKDIFMLAACVGFEKRQRKPLGKGKEQPFHYSVFSEKTDIPILKAIAIATTQDIQVLANFDEIMSIAEEYANSGIQDIRMYVVDQTGQPLWNLVESLRGY